MCVTLYYKLACTVYICWVGGVNVKVVDRGKGPVVECSVWSVELFTINLHVLYVCVCGGGGVAGVNVELVNRSKGPVIVECVGLFTRLMHVLYMYVRGVLLEIYIYCILNNSTCTCNF